ncbi:MAG TPA: MBL fold metallo-hydrolase [Baekduia sp.]|nr:MBL fold metallo-hydrolase [Baekduia sp.]
MNIRRLGWAGVELEAEDGAVAVIDLLESTESMRAFMGEPHTPLPGPSRPGSAVVALVTHLHGDHTDPDAIAAALGEDGVLLRPAPDTGPFLEIAATLEAEKRLVELGVRQRIVNVWETVVVGPFRATAVPAVDGFGDPQVGWVVEADGTRVYHHGDTLFHGSWWRARMRVGDIDVAFLPVNGPLVSLPHRQPGSPRNAVMSPAEAAAAAQLLGARVAVPIHYDTINNPPIYAQTDDPAGAFAREGAALGVDVRVLEPGERLVTEGATTAA